MIAIEYCENGNPVSDFNINDWVYNIMQNKEKDCIFRVSTSLPVDAIRFQIVLENISCKLVTFVYCGLVFQANKYGVISDWPKGFADRHSAIAEDILRQVIKLKRKEQKT